MPDPIDSKDPAARQILRAAAHLFAVTPYGRVGVDDVLARADVTKSAFYKLFPSKMALATALVDYHFRLSRTALTRRVELGLRGLEALIDYAYVIATADVSHELTRAAFNLFESVGRFEGLQAQVSRDWIDLFADLASDGIARGDIRPECDPRHVAQLMTSTYLGVRQTSDLDDAHGFVGDFEALLLLVLPGFANPDRQAYLVGFVKRRSALAVKNAAPLGTDKL